MPQVTPAEVFAQLLQLALSSANDETERRLMSALASDFQTRKSVSFKTANLRETIRERWHVYETERGKKIYLSEPVALPDPVLCAHYDAKELRYLGEETVERKSEPAIAVWQSLVAEWIDFEGRKHQRRLNGDDFGLTPTASIAELAFIDQFLRLGLWRQFVEPEPSEKPRPTPPDPNAEALSIISELSSLDLSTRAGKARRDEILRRAAKALPLDCDTQERKAKRLKSLAESIGVVLPDVRRITQILAE